MSVIKTIWDQTFEVNKFGAKENFKNYFVGVPKHRGSHLYFVLECLLYLPPFFGCLFVPAKNFVKLFTEFFAKCIDAVCENALKDPAISPIFKGLATLGHYAAKMWWVCLRPMTSPIVSAKAAWETKNLPLRILLTLLSVSLSVCTMLLVMVIVPNAFFSLLGHAGGVLTSLSHWISSMTRAVPGLPPHVAGFTPANFPMMLANPARRRLEHSTHIYLSEKFTLQEIPPVPPPVTKEVYEFSEVPGEMRMSPSLSLECSGK